MPMHKDRTLFFLNHARIMLDALIKDMEEDTEFDGFPDLMNQLPFVYQNLNRAWNEHDLKDDLVSQVHWDGYPSDLPGMSDCQSPPGKG